MFATRVQRHISIFLRLLVGWKSTFPHCRTAEARVKLSKATFVLCENLVTLETLKADIFYRKIRKTSNFLCVQQNSFFRCKSYDFFARCLFLTGLPAECTLHQYQHCITSALSKYLPVQFRRIDNNDQTN